MSSRSYSELRRRWRNRRASGRRYLPPGPVRQFVITKYHRYFTRPAAKVGARDRFTEIVAEATWSECIALALQQLERADMSAISAHPLVKAKHSLSPTAELRQVVWGALGKHTVETRASQFGVPSNLYAIGTMNTASKSTEALDAVPRRRFETQGTTDRRETWFVRSAGQLFAMQFRNEPRTEGLTRAARART